MKTKATDLAASPFIIITYVAVLFNYLKIFFKLKIKNIL